MKPKGKALFAQICKVDVPKREVWGLATEEVTDTDDEVMYYDKCKPEFESWSQHAQEITDGVSLGNLRYMHQLDAVGRLISIQFDDATKQVHIGTKVVDDSAWNKVLEKVLTGFSIGLRNVKFEGKKYWGKVVEISLVDLGALPSAVFDLVKADGSVEKAHFAKEVTVIKAEGKTKRVAGEDLPPSAFAYVGSKDDTSSWKLPLHFSSKEKSARHCRNALARFNQTQGIPEGDKAKVHAKIVAACKRYGIEVSEESDKAAKKAAKFAEFVEEVATKAMESCELTKSMGSITDLSEILQRLRGVLMDALWEAEYEGEGGDDRDAAIAVEVQAAIEHLIEIMKDVVDEETSELLPKAAAKAAETDKGEAMDWTELQKKAATLGAHFRKVAAHHKAMAEHHKAMAEHHEAHAESHKAAMGCCKAAEPDGDEHESHRKDFHKSGHEHHKAIAAHHTKCMKAHEAMEAHHNKMAEGHEAEEKAARLEVEKAAGGKPAGEETMKTEDIVKAISDGFAALKPAEPKPVEKAAEPVLTKAEQEAAVTATVTKAVTDAIGGLNIAKLVEDQVAAAVKATQTAPAPVPLSFSLIPRDASVQKAATAVSDNDTGF